MANPITTASVAATSCGLRLTPTMLSPSRAVRPIRSVLSTNFFGVYEALTMVGAESLFKAWEASLAPEIVDAFYPLTRAVNNWMPEIMAYFDQPVTNSYAEALNGLIRVANRMGRGYSFEALRAKILFTEGVQKKSRHRPKFQRKQEGFIEYFNPFALGRGAASSTFEDDLEINLGSGISTLVRWIEESKL